MAEFSWAAAGDVGLGILGGVSQAVQAAGASSRARSEARAANIVREGQNQVRREKLNLASTVRDINNRRTIEAAAEQQETLTRNALRTSDSFARGKFEESIRNAEQWGRSASEAAASGVGGAGIEAISQVTNLQIARRQQLTQEQGEQTVQAAADRTTDVMSRAIMGLQGGALSGGLDVSRNVASTSQSSTANVAGFLIQGLLSKADSLQVALGSLEADKPRQNFAFEGATSYPVADQNVATTRIDPSVSPYEDMQRMINRSRTTRGL